MAVEELDRLRGHRIAVIGAGPIGLEAALYAATLGADVRVYERGAVAASVEAWGHIQLFTPFRMNHTPLGRARLEAEGWRLPRSDARQSGAEWREAYLAPLAASAPLAGRIVAGARVVTVGRGGLLKGDHIGDGERARRPFRLLVETADGERYEEADVVLDCSGSYTNPNWLGEGGVPAIGERAARDGIVYHPIDVGGAERDRYAGRRVLLVGGGYSAATTAVALAELAGRDPDTRTIWLTRAAGPLPVARVEDDPLPRRAELADAANALVGDPRANVEWVPGAGVIAVYRAGAGEGFDVVMRTPAGERRERVDRIIANVGYGPDDSLYRELQVHECYASRAPMKLAAALLSATSAAGGDCTKVGELGPETLANPEPGFYIVGVKSYGRNPLFLLQNGYRQIRDVFRLIAGEAGLDLYADAAGAAASAG